MRTAVVACALATASPAAADPLSIVCGARGQPVPVGVRDGGFDAERGACLTGELAVRITGVAAIDTPEFYGTLAGGFAISFHRAITDHLELGATLNGYRVTFAQDAVIKALDGTVGPLVAHLGVGQSVKRDPSATGRSAAVLAFTIPGTHVGGEVTELGVQLAAIRSMALSPRWAFHARAALLAWFAGSAGGTSDRYAMILGGDAVVAATGRVSFGVGVDFQAGWRGALDHILARPGLRVRLTRGSRLELGAGLTLAGQERVDAAVTLGLVLAE